MTNRYHMSPPDYGPGTLTWAAVALLVGVLAVMKGCG